MALRIRIFTHIELGRLINFLKLIFLSFLLANCLNNS